MRFVLVFLISAVASWAQSACGSPVCAAEMNSKPTAALVTSVGTPGLDTNVPSEKAVRTAIGASGVFTANEASGLVTCNFSLGGICHIVFTDTSLTLVPTITNLPTNQFVYFLFDTTAHTGLGVTWPTSSPEVLCGGTDLTSGDAWADCGAGGTLNGWIQNPGINSSTAWSTGTKLYMNPDSGFFQTVRAAHVDVLALGVGNSNGVATATLAYGAILRSNSAGGVNAIPTVAATDATHCGSGATVSANASTNNMVITMGSTANTTVCPVTFGTNAQCPLISTCVAEDQTTFQHLKCVGGTTGLTITAQTSMTSDVVSVLNICQ